MSSSRPRNRSKRTSSQTSYYPTEWSEWEWDTDQRDWKRYRLKAPDQYEFEYERTSVTATNPAEPRTSQPSLGPVLEGSYSASANYALSSDPTAEITRGLARTALNATTSFPPRNPTPVGASEQTHITTVNPYTDKEEFDPHYKVHKPFEFKQGRVFKVLWSEPQGTGGGRGDGSSNPETVTEGINKYGEKSFQKVRRFVIIRPLSGHCICLPINTYSRQGVTKNGVHAGDHTIAYSGSKPVYFKGERAKGMTKKPLKIVTKNPRHKLADTSRLNYAKTYTVEYNVKVWFIGNVDKDYMWHLVTDFNQVHPPLGTYGLTEPSAFQEGETSYADGGMDDYVAPTQTYGSSRAPTASYPPKWNAQQYVTTYGQPQSTYGVAPEDYNSSQSEASYDESRPSRSRGKGKETQRDDAPAYDIAERPEEQEHVYDPAYVDPHEPEYKPPYRDVSIQARHAEADHVEHHREPTPEHQIPVLSPEPLPSEAAEYVSPDVNNYPAATEDYPQEHHEEYTEPGSAHEDDYEHYPTEHTEE